MIKKQIEIIDRGGDIIMRLSESNIETAIRIIKRNTDWTMRFVRHVTKSNKKEVDE